MAPSARQGLRPRPARRWFLLEPNPVDSVWTDRPAPPLGAVVMHDLKFAGEGAAEKLARVQAEIGKLKADALIVMSDPHNVAWTFNIRGADVSHTPLPLAFATVPKEGRAFALCRRPQALQRGARLSRNASPTCASPTR